MGSLRFKQIQLTGFKSFVEPTLFLIEPGLTGIVGPNGCGKSNLLEAIRWVMGANSAKAMRAGGMDDVIFSGTKNRPGRNTANVTLYIDNSARIAPSAFNDSDDLEVTRIINKGAGSKYKVNGKTVRAKDVQLLFADASTGANSPALVRQGQINELIAAKPSNRRKILEEAAGISGLHSRRHEAELRLRAAENNLERLDDVLGQMEAQLLSLRRQSRQAARYKRLAAEIREYRALLWLRRWDSALATLAADETAQRDAAKHAEDLTAQAASLVTKTEGVAGTIPPLREELAVAAAVCVRLQAAQANLDAEEAAAGEAMAALVTRSEAIAGDIQRETDIEVDAKDALERLAKERLDASNNDDISGALASAEQVSKAAIAKRNEIEQLFRAQSGKLAAFDAERAGAQRAHETEQTRIEKLSSELISLAALKTRLENGEQAADGSLFDAARTDASEALMAARSREQECRQARQEAEKTERGVHEAMVAARQAVSEAQAEEKAIRSVLRVGGQTGWRPALDDVSVKTGYEIALAAALGDDLDAAIDHEAPMRWTGAAAPEQALPDGAKPLTDFVKAPGELHARLSQIGLVDAARGAALSGGLKPGQRLVSVGGDIWRWDGFYAAGDVPSAAALRLENENRLAEITASLEGLVGFAETAQRDWQSAREALTRANEAANQARAALPALIDSDRDAQNAFARYETDQVRQAAELSALKERMSRLETEQSDAEIRAKDLAAQLGALQDTAALETELVAVQTQLNRAQSEADAASGKYHGLRSENEARRQRAERLESETQAWTQRGETARMRVETLNARQLETNAALTAAREKPSDMATRRATLLSEISAAEKRRDAASDALSTAEAAMRDCEQAQRQGEQKLASARENWAASKARLTAASERRDEVRTNIEETLGCLPDELTGQLEMLSPDSSLSAPDIDKKLDRLSKERERIGAVNLRADAEAAEQEERMAAMSEERADVVAAIARLREGIDNLNSEGRARLLAAFDTVNGHFGRLFTTLFGGGNAALALTESDDPLEAGLEILVSPPGKKLGSMSLLSGGEQALTATALIFAVFLSNPAPICVLDEVDAPLDDANVARYCDLLDEMSKNTQTRFMVITHNPVTMARMDRIFGVTMAEKGVSQLVSIDLAGAESLSAA